MWVMSWKISSNRYIRYIILAKQFVSVRILLFQMSQFSCLFIRTKHKWMPVLHHNGCWGSVDRRQPHGIWSRTLRDGRCKDNRKYNYWPAGPTACWLHYSSIGHSTSLWNFWFWLGRRSRRLLKESKLIAKMILLSWLDSSAL